MALLSALRNLRRARSRQRETCFSCIHYCDDPTMLEQALPGLAVLSSGSASVRAQDGLCLRHDLLINGRRRCIAFREHPVPHQPIGQRATGQKEQP